MSNQPQQQFTPKHTLMVEHYPSLAHSSNWKVMVSVQALQLYTPREPQYKQPFHQETWTLRRCSRPRSVGHPVMFGVFTTSTLVPLTGTGYFKHPCPACLIFHFSFLPTSSSLAWQAWLDSFSVGVLEVDAGGQNSAGSRPLPAGSFFPACPRPGGRVAVARCCPAAAAAAGGQRTPGCGAGGRPTSHRGPPGAGPPPNFAARGEPGPGPAAAPATPAAPRAGGEATWRRLLHFAQRAQSRLHPCASRQR